VPTENEIYGTLSQYDPEESICFVIDVLNTVCPKRKSGSRGIIIDSTAINLHLNWNAKKISKECLEEKEYSMENLHRYTKRSVQKYCFLAVLLVGMTVNLGIREKKDFQAFAE
jgi:hypothetical protein